ncbi:MAG: hypothetical protein ACYC59_12045 [Anaerolineaceae bacterium]
MNNKLNIQSINIPEEEREELLRICPEVRTDGGQIVFDRLRLVLGELSGSWSARTPSERSIGWRNLKSWWTT